MCEMFVKHEGRIADIRPRQAVALPDIIRPGEYRMIAVTHRNCLPSRVLLGTSYQLGAMTRRKAPLSERKITSVFFFNAVFCSVSKIPHTGVNVLDHRGVSGHAVRFPFLVLSRCSTEPRADRVATAASFVNDAHGNLPLITIRPDGVPPGEITRTIFGDVFFRRLQRPVWCGVGDVEKNGLSPFARRLMSARHVR